MYADRFFWDSDNWPHISVAIRSLDTTTGAVLLDQQAVNEIIENPSDPNDGWFRATDAAGGKLFVADNDNAYLATGNRLSCTEGHPINNEELYFSSVVSLFEDQPQICRHLFYVSGEPRRTHPVSSVQGTTPQATDQDDEEAETTVPYSFNAKVQDALYNPKNHNTKYAIVGCEAIECRPDDPRLQWNCIKLTAPPAWQSLAAQVRPSALSTVQYSDSETVGGNRDTEVEMVESQVRDRFDKTKLARRAMSI